MDHQTARVDYRNDHERQEEKQYHLQVSPEDVASVVLVPGSRQRAKMIGGKLDRSEKIADNRGLITISGEYKRNLFTVTATGMGGPSAAIAYEELINLGAQVLIRVGSMGGLQPDVEKGDVVIPYAAVRDDGLSSEYVPTEFPAVATPQVYQALLEASETKEHRFHTGVNLTHDAFYSRASSYFDSWAGKRVKSVEMEGSTLFVVSHLRGVWSGLIGTCVSTQAHEGDHGEKVTIEPEAESEKIDRGTELSVDVALLSGCKLYEKYGPNFETNP